MFWGKKLKDGNGRWVGCEFVFFKALIVDGGEEERGFFIFFHFFIFMFVIFWGLLLIKEGGKWAMALFYLKILKKLLIFLIVCKFSIFFFIFEGEKGGTGLGSINIICIY